MSSLALAQVLYMQPPNAWPKFSNDRNGKGLQVHKFFNLEHAWVRADTIAGYKLTINIF